MGMGHVPPGPLREAGAGDHLPRCEHRGGGAGRGALSERRRKLARFGEEVAAGFLRRRGAVVVGRNVRVGRGELDLVVRFGRRHVAVEVKTVGGDAGATEAIERIDDRKLAQVRRLAGRLSPHLGPLRVDFVGVCVSGEGVRVNWRRAVA